MLADDTGDPLRNARVGLGEDADAPAALTDADGRFTLTDVPSGQRLSAAKTGYVKTSIAASADLEIRLTKGAAITGRVLDDAGDPMPLVTVVADRAVQTGGVTSFERAATVEANDLGEYRLFGLPPGEFVVSIAGARIFQGPAAAPVVSLVQPLHNYYPHADTPDAAQRIPLAAGEEKPGIDLTIPLPPYLPRPPGPADAAAGWLRRHRRPRAPRRRCSRPARTRSPEPGQTTASRRSSR